MPDNRPRGREKNVTGKGKDIYKRGSGTGTGPVGNGGGYSGRNSDDGDRGVDAGQALSALSGLSGILKGGSKKKLILIIIIVVVVLLIGGPKISSLLSGLSSTTSGLFDASSLLGSLPSSSTSSDWNRKANTETLNTKVAAGARDRYTTIKGNGKDQVTIMIYMCGTDLESKSGMASSDLGEMAAATLSNNVNVLVYTGGCKGWKTSGISNSTNQIYKFTNDGKLQCLEKDMGNKAMTKPDTLTEFIKYCAKNYEANRYELIFWDHGGGSLSGYGYDERFTSSGSMTLSGINTALKNANVKFDFIGFDACLMATAENALMLTSYADYLIASEETEPGIGWYYTNWLTKLSANPSMSTLEIGKQIADDFTDMCKKKVSNAQTTLSVIDLAELEATVPEGLSDFATSTTNLIKSNDYQTVSDARSSTREFASSSKIDQVDLVNLADNIGTKEAKELSEIILSCVKYNRTSSSMTNCYGLSIYFPYQKTSGVDSAIKTYDAIGMDDDYAKCIKSFAQLETAGQVSTGGSSSPLGSLTGSLFSGSGLSFDTGSISSLLSGFMGGGSGKSIAGLDSSNTEYMSDLDVNSASSYISKKAFDATNLVWEQNKRGEWIMPLSEDQWKLVHSLELNVFYDDGEGYIDLGLDNVYDWNDDGQLIGAYDGTWIAINGQPVPYYHVNTTEIGKNYVITGYVPVLLNNEPAKLILTFTNDDPYGSVTSVEYTYNGDTDTVAKNDYVLQNGDVIDFICDYYKYDGTYDDSYRMGDQLTVNGKLTISNVEIDASKADAVYRFTDIYNQVYWSQPMK